MNDMSNNYDYEQDIREDDKNTMDCILEDSFKENDYSRFKAVDDEGQVRECETLFMFESTEMKKNYIVYTDNSVDEEGSIRVYASIYDPETLDTTSLNDFIAMKLEPIETEREWEIIESLLNDLAEINSD